MYTIVDIRFPNRRLTYDFDKASHRAIYRHTLRAIQDNTLLDGPRHTKLVEVRHDCKNHTKLVVRFDLCITAEVTIQTLAF